MLTVCIVCFEGKTADTYICQKKSDGTFKKCYISTGGAWVGDKVNEAFDRMIIKIVGACCFQQFKDDNSTDYVDMHKELETNKRIFDPKSDFRISITLPASFNETLEKGTGTTINKTIQQTEYANKLTFRKGQLKMDADLFKELFREPVDMLVGHLRQLMAEDNLSGISTVLMVGKFSESRMMLDAIMKAFPDKRVIVPYEPDLAVIQGALWFAYKSNAVPESNPPGLL